MNGWSLGSVREEAGKGHMGEDALSTIRGQDEAVALLRQAVATGRVAHSYAFVGPAGTGRKLTALAFAKTLVAPEGGRAAERVDRGAHPDVRLIAPTPPEGNPKGPQAVRIESIRALERLAALRPAEASTKVFIVDDADRMTVATPQAFLKTLEEPPERTVIILILTQLRALPATVLSRCQVVRFRPHQLEGTVALLPDGRSQSRSEALGLLAAAQAGGADAILKSGEAVGRDREKAERVVDACWLWYRDLLCDEVGADSRLRVFRETTDRPRETRALDQVLTALAACREAWQALQGNVSPRLTVEVLLSRLGLEMV
jgi:DNA polymerase III subunit delta'